jgi:hypothetical protein
MKCETCKFTPQKEGGSLTCQRYPQSIRVARSYFCGEYQAMEETDGKANKGPASRRVSRNQGSERVGGEVVAPFAGSLPGVDD